MGHFARNARACKAAHVFCRDSPVPVTFLGFEVGESVFTGGGLAKDDHLYAVLCDHRSSCGRRSWDPMLVCLALAGDPTAAGYKTVRGVASVDAETGENHFQPALDGLHEYVIKSRPDEFYAEYINAKIG